MNVAIIPARGGSKRITNKNIKRFYGKPIISYSIDAAIRSGIFERIVVSTDSDEIAKISIEYGAEAPFIRPKALSDDYTGTVPVVRHAIQWMSDQGEQVDSVCCIYPASPFIRSENILRAYDLVRSGEWGYVFAATEYPSSIFRAFLSLPGGGVRMVFPEKYQLRTQDLDVALHDAAQFYWANSNVWMERDVIFDEQSCALKLPRWQVQDVDTLEDWEMAELLYEVMNMKEKDGLNGL